VEDCLELMSSLLAFNGTTQNDFRESGHIRRLAKLLTLDNGEEVADYSYAQRNMNIVRTLAVVRLFVVPGGSATKDNQDALFNSGASEQVLNIAFSPKIELDVRAEVRDITCSYSALLTE
jgi:intracellular protein transport protein USO1